MRGSSGLLRCSIWQWRYRDAQPGYLAWLVQSQSWHLAWFIIPPSTHCTWLIDPRTATSLLDRPSGTSCNSSSRQRRSQAHCANGLECGLRLLQALRHRGGDLRTPRTRAGTPREPTDWLQQQVIPVVVLVRQTIRRMPGNPTVTSDAAARAMRISCRHEQARVCCFARSRPGSTTGRPGGIAPGPRRE